MNRAELEALAYDEALCLLETSFSFDNPYTCVIDLPPEISFNDESAFYRQVEEELAAKGEKIAREGEFFKILRYQN